MDIVSAADEFNRGGKLAGTISEDDGFVLFGEDGDCGVGGSSASQGERVGIVDGLGFRLSDGKGMGGGSNSGGRSGSSLSGVRVLVESFFSGVNSKSDDQADSETNDDGQENFLFHSFGVKAVL